MRVINRWLTGSIAVLVLGATFSASAGTFDMSLPEISAESPAPAQISPEIKVLLQENNLRPAQYQSPAPDFTLRDLDGRKVSLSQFRGQTVLLGFFTTW